MHKPPLTPEQVLRIKHLYFKEGWTQARLAREFQRGTAQIGKIVRGEAHQGVKSLAELEVEGMEREKENRTVLDELARLSQLAIDQPQGLDEPEFLKPTKPIPYPTKG